MVLISRGLHKHRAIQIKSGTECTACKCNNTFVGIEDDGPGLVEPPRDEDLPVIGVVEPRDLDAVVERVGPIEIQNRHIRQPHRGHMP